MLNILKYTFSIFLFMTMITLSQSEKVHSGPMLSYVDGYGTQIWFLLDRSVQKIDVDVRDYDNDNLIEYSFNVPNDYDLNQIPFTISIETLLPNTEYIASIFVDDVFLQDIDIFTKRPHLDDVQFLLGSDFDLSSSRMLPYMTETYSDFMVWLGGHVSFSFPITLEGILSHYIELRKDDQFDEFLTSVPQIATWNNRDYGLSMNSPFALKDTSHIAFDLFWPNSSKKTYNYTYFDYGVYQRYSYNDVDLFLLDAMTFRSEDKSQLYGNKQIDRLFQEIKNTGATFTIIASPLPFTFETNESFLNYQKEFDYFLYRLEVSDVKGVVLLSANGSSGTMMNEYKFKNQLAGKLNQKKSLFEFNTSPLHMQNYSLVSISGKQGYRIFTFETFNQNGNVIYRKSLYENDLRIN